MDNHNSDAMELTMNLVRIDSTDPGAYEGEIGEFIFQYLKGLDVPVIKKEVLPSRFNVMASWRGRNSSRARLYLPHGHCHHRGGLDCIPLWRRSNQRPHLRPGSL